MFFLEGEEVLGGFEVGVAFDVDHESAEGAGELGFGGPASAGPLALMACVRALVMDSSVSSSWLM